MTPQNLTTNRLQLTTRLPNNLYSWLKDFCILKVLHTVFLHYSKLEEKNAIKRIIRENTFTALYILLKKNPHVSGPAQSKLMLFEDQLYMILFHFVITCILYMRVMKHRKTNPLAQVYTQVVSGKAGIWAHELWIQSMPF